MVTYYGGGCVGLAVVVVVVVVVVVGAAAVVVVVLLWHAEPTTEKWTWIIWKYRKLKLNANNGENCLRNQE